MRNLESGPSSITNLCMILRQLFIYIKIEMSTQGKAALPLGVQEKHK